MPAQVTKTITVAGLRKDDVIVDGLPAAHANPPLTFTESELKPVWAQVHYLDGEGHDFVQRMRRDAVVTVHRLEPTEKELEAKHRQMTIFWLRNKLEQLLGGDDGDPFTKLEEYVARARAGGWNELVDHWNLDTFLKAQASWKIGRLIQHLYEKKIDALTEAGTVPPNGESVEDFAIFEAWAMFYANKTREERRFGQVSDPLSRSTSITSNLFEDLDRYAVDRLLYDVRWYVERDLDARADELVKEWDEANKR